MSPATGSNGGSGSGGGGPPTRKKKSPSGVTKIALAPKGEEVSVAYPMPVVLTWGTIVKFASVIVIPLLAGISFAIFFFHKTNIHMGDPTVHLTRGERGKLETKAEACAARDKLAKSISKELTVKTRELKQDLGDQNRAQFRKLGKELKSDQNYRFSKILEEVKKARRDIRNQ